VFLWNLIEESKTMFLLFIAIQSALIIIIIIIIILYLPRTHTTQRARRTNSIWQVQQGYGYDGTEMITVYLAKSYLIAYYYRT